MFYCLLLLLLLAFFACLFGILFIYLFWGLGFIFSAFVYGYFSISHTALIMAATLHRGLPYLPKVLVILIWFGLLTCSQGKNISHCPIQAQLAHPRVHKVPTPISLSLHISVHLLHPFKKPQAQKQFSLEKKKKVINSNKIANCRHEIHNVFVI